MPAPAPAYGGGGGGGARKRKKPIKKDSKFQWHGSGKWQDYDGATDARLKQAFLVGRPGAKFKVNTNGGEEEYQMSFKKGNMAQTNVKTGKSRDIRPPWGMSAPNEPVLPEGDFIVVTLKPNQVGQETIEVTNPRDKSSKIKVSLPKKTKAGQKIAVPIPAPGESVEAVAKKQEGMTTGGKVAMGLGVCAVAGAAAVGGVILGDHLAGGSLIEDGADSVQDAAGDVADFVTGDVDLLEDAGDFAEDVGDWLGDATEDVGDWICSVF